MARVLEVDGQLVLDDPAALAMVRAVAKHNCALTFEAQRDRVAHFARRVGELGRAPGSLLIVLLNVNDVVGGEVARRLMPDSDALWENIRARGETPYARGLVERAGFVELLPKLDAEAADKLRGMVLGVVVMDHGAVEVFDAD